MDLSGFEHLNEVLGAAGVYAKVTPQPEEGENKEFVTIDTDLHLQPQEVLNAMGKAGLIAREGGLVSGKGKQGIPWFEILGVQPGSITLKDKKYSIGRIL